MSSYTTGPVIVSHLPYSPDMSATSSEIFYDDEDHCFNITDHNFNESVHVVKFESVHVTRAFQVLDKYRIPESADEYLKNFMPHDWRSVAIRVYLAFKMKKIKKLNAYQEQLVRMWIYEDAPKACTECGLPNDAWCGRWGYVEK
jgi:hypothetical protein